MVKSYNGPARIQNRNFLFKCARRLIGHPLEKDFRSFQINMRARGVALAKVPSALCQHLQLLRPLRPLISEMA